MRLKLGQTEDMPQGSTALVVEGRIYLVTREGDLFYVLDGVCTHRGGDLSRGRIEGGTVRCPRHGAVFDLRNGELKGQVRIPLIGKASALRSYPSWEEDGWLFIEV